LRLALSIIASVHADYLAGQADPASSPDTVQASTTAQVQNGLTRLAIREKRSWTIVQIASPVPPSPPYHLPSVRIRHTSVLFHERKMLEMHGADDSPVCQEKVSSFNKALLGFHDVRLDLCWQAVAFAE